MLRVVLAFWEGLFAFSSDLFWTDCFIGGLDGRNLSGTNHGFAEEFWCMHCSRNAGQLLEL